MKTSGQKHDPEHIFAEFFHIYGALFERYIHRKCRRRVAGFVDSADLIQEVYLLAWRSFHTFRGNSARGLFHWLCGIANREMINQGRKWGAIKRGGHCKFMSFTDIPTTLTKTTAPRYCSNPQQELLRKERREQLDAAFSQLSHQEQQMLRLRQCEGLRSKEISKKLGMKVGTINVIFYRARHKWGGILIRFHNPNFSKKVRYAANLFTD